MLGGCLFRAGIVALCLICGSGSVAVAGPVILTVTGLDAARYPDGMKQFDIEGLRALGQVEISTTSIWTDGKIRFTGVPMKTLTDSLGIDQDELRLHALNAYQVTFPLAEATDHAPVLAYAMDGKPMSVRDKGPIWLIYPYDEAAEYRTDTIFARSIWQLDRIEVLP